MSTEQLSGGGSDAPPESTHPVLRSLGVAVGLLLLAVFLANVLGGLPLVVVLLTFGGLTERVLPVFLLATIVLIEFGYLLVGASYVLQYADGVEISVPDRRDVGWILGAFTVVFAISQGVDLVVATLDLETGSGVIEAQLPNQTQILVWFAVLSILLVGPAEEFLFRGAIQGRLGETLGPWTAILVATMLFTVVHVPNYLGTTVAVVGLTAVFAVSLVLGYAYERTQNLTVPILVHGFYNAALAAVQVL